MQSQIILNGIPPEDFWEQLRGIVQDVVSTLPKPEKVKIYLNLVDVCELTGFSKSTLYQLTHSKQIPHIKRGGKLLFNRAELIEWIQASRQPIQQ